MDAEIKVLSVEIGWIAAVPCLKPGVGQNVA